MKEKELREIINGRQACWSGKKKKKIAEKQGLHAGRQRRRV